MHTSSMLFKGPMSPEALTKNYPAIFATSAKESVSGRYLYIPTHTIVDNMQSQGFKIVGAKQSAGRLGGEHVKHVVYLTHPSLSTGTVNEELALIALSNSHNGSSAFTIDTAFFRLVCANGLLMPTTSISSARIVHRIGMQDDVLVAASRIVDNFGTQVAQIKELKNTVMSSNDSAAFATRAQDLFFSPEQIALNTKHGNDLRTQLLKTRRFEDANPSLWNVFNRVQENLIKGGARLVTLDKIGNAQLTRTRPIKSIDRDTKVNKQLMELALNFVA